MEWIRDTIRPSTVQRWTLLYPTLEQELGFPPASTATAFICLFCLFHLQGERAGHPRWPGAVTKHRAHERAS